MESFCNSCYNKESPFGGYFSKEVFSMKNMAFIKLVYEKQLGGDIYYEP